MKLKSFTDFSQEIWGIGSIKFEFVLQRNLEAGVSSISSTVAFSDCILQNYVERRSGKKLKVVPNLK